MAWPDYKSYSIAGRIMAEVPVSDGSMAYRIQGFRVDSLGQLVNRFALMPLIPDEWRGASQPEPFVNRCLAMRYAEMEDGIPELLFVCTDGIFRYAPETRASGGTHPGLAEQYYWDSTNESVLPQGSTRYPPQMETMGNRIYISFCDGGSLWVWDRERVRPFGFAQRPSPPAVNGPQRKDANSPNSGGFSARGRIGSLESDWTLDVGGTPTTVGGMDNGRWQYYVVYEGPDGGYSSTSGPGGMATTRLQLADPANSVFIESLARRFRVLDIPRGPAGTAARILLRTRNLLRLPGGDQGEPRFLHRLHSNRSTQYIDDIPDGELGDRWWHREVTPTGIYMLRSYSGSLWLLRSEAYPSRVWWSEQTSVFGATPESILKGHYLDVHPETGPITGTLVSRFTDQDGPVLLVFKAGAVHYIYGEYPAWRIGTAHSRAGLAGPNLVQAIPDGTVIWYGAGTFWQMEPGGRITDIGTPIRETLNTVSPVAVPMGCSWVDTEHGEVVFCLPVDDSELAGTQFCWDYRLSGWRLAVDVLVRAAETVGDTVLLAGEYDSTDTVWAYHRGYPGYTVTVPTARYISGWCVPDIGRELGTFWAASFFVLQLQERTAGLATAETYSNWDGDNPVDNALTFSRSYPQPSVLTEASDVPIPYYDDAVYDSDVYRSYRTYQYRMTGDVPSYNVLQLRIATQSVLAIQDLMVFGPRQATAGGRTPTLE